MVALVAHRGKAGAPKERESAAGPDGGYMSEIVVVYVVVDVIVVVCPQLLAR